MSAEPKTAYVALGANLGNAVETLRRAAVEIAGWSLGQALGSSLWQTQPLDCPPGSPPFINAALGLQPKLDATPELLLESLLQLEIRLGRERSGLANEPRKIDLDLITFGDEERNCEILVLPHPRAHEREFVLAPLNELAPNFILPGRAETVSAMLKKLPPQGAMKLEESLLG